MKKKSVLLIIFSILVFLGGIFVLYFAFKESSRNSQIEKEIEELKKEAERIQKNNLELQEKIAYFQMPEFRERIAKEKLNLQKEGENVAIIKQSPSLKEINSKEKEKIISQDNSVSMVPNWKKWRKYFFGI